MGVHQTPLKLLITGASSGIGQMIARRRVQHGDGVWGLARSPTTLEAPGAEASAGEFYSGLCDVSDWDAMAGALREVSRHWTYLDGLICCAGIHGAVGPAMATEPSQWANAIRTNLEGTYYAIRASFACLRQSPNRPKVICFSGGGATQPRPCFSAYAAAKAGVVRLVETLAAEWQDLAIDINAVAPGAINTRLTEEIVALGPDRAGAKEYESAQQQRDAGGASTERMFGLIDFLLSERSNGLSGKLISAQWDPWEKFPDYLDALAQSDVYNLRRISTQDRNPAWIPNILKSP